MSPPNAPNSVAHIPLPCCRIAADADHAASPRDAAVAVAEGRVRNVARKAAVDILYPQVAILAGKSGYMKPMKDTEWAQV
jgi:hypothetical protein